MKDIPGKVHFIGIGGAGMSGLASILAALGYVVTGSDIKDSTLIETLKQRGIRCFIGHYAENLGDAEMVVVSSAIPPKNPELVSAKEKGIPIIHRGEMLAKLMTRQKGIAVAGSHGKTTTTSMMSLVLEKLGYDPTIVIGGELADIGGNAKLGQGEYLVAEADESDGSFLWLKPQLIILTNIEDDHMDYYQTTENMLATFEKFINNLSISGTAVLCYDDANVRKILPKLSVPYKTYGISEQAEYRLKNVMVNGQLNAADVYHREHFIGRLELQVPGQHNILNALAVVVLALHLGLSFKEVAGILKQFKGANRRYQLLGEVGGIKVIDDYAHHPTEIKATLQGARETKPGRLIGVFQPHRYTRTKQLYNQFGAALSDADIIIINSIYSAGETPIEGVTAELIVDAAKKNNVREVTYIEELHNIAPYLASITQPGDIIITMGAGNIWQAGLDLVRELKENF